MASPTPRASRAVKRVLAVVSMLGACVLAACGPPGRQFIWVLSGSSPVHVRGYETVHDSGELRLVSDTPFDDREVTLFSSPAQDPAGRFLILPAHAARRPGRLNVFRIDPGTKKLTIVPGSPFPTGYFAGQAAIEPRGRYVYVLDEDLDAGRATSGGIVIDRDRAHSGIWAYAIDAETERLTPVNGSPFPIRYGTWSIVVHPSGSWVYVIGGPSIAALRIDPQTGALMPVPGSPFPLVSGQTSGGAWSLAFAPSGRHAYVVHADFGVLAYAVARDGALRPLPQPPLAAGNAYGSAVEPRGRFLYVTDQGVRSQSTSRGPTPFVSGTVHAYAIDPESGDVSPVPGSPFPAEPDARKATHPGQLIVDHLGHYLYARTDGARFVGFRIDPASGALTRFLPLASD